MSPEPDQEKNQAEGQYSGEDIIGDNPVPDLEKQFSENPPEGEKSEHQQDDDQNDNVDHSKNSGSGLGKLRINFEEDCRDQHQKDHNDEWIEPPFFHQIFEKCFLF